MTERENLPAKFSAHGLVATTEKCGSLVARGMAAVLVNTQHALTKNNDALYRQAREVYNRLTDDGLGSWFGYKERELPLTEVFNLFQKLAAKGYGKAYYPLSTLYGGEQSINGDPIQAERFRKLAFDWLFDNQLQNDPEIWNDLGKLYLTSGGDNYNDMDIAIRWFLKAANMADACSMWHISCMYEFGYRGLFPEGTDSLYWQIKAAKAGHEEAQSGLEQQHEHGDLESKIDDGQVFNWYVWSAEHGHVWAQLFLAEASRRGAGVDRNDEQATNWFHMAAEQGYPWSEADLFRDLGIRYRYGDDGTQPDDEKARKYFLLAANLYRDAAESGEGWGQFGLGQCYRTGHGVEHDDGQAVYWLRKAAVQGDGSGQFALGDMYKSGLGVAQDDEQAVYWFRKSAEQGIDLGQFKLGLSYKAGRGVAQDNEQAAYWLSQAAEQGQALAKLALKNLGLDWKKK